MPTERQVYENICKGRFDHVDTELAQIDRTLRGSNGSPGLMARLAALELLATNRARLSWLLVGTTEGVISAVTIFAIERYF